MRPEIHPAYKPIKVNCSCGNIFETSSTLGRDLHIEICAKCHPFYTGTQKLIDTAGRVDRFRQKYGAKTKAAAKPAVEQATQAAAPAVEKPETKVAAKPAEKAEAKVAAKSADKKETKPSAKKAAPKPKKEQKEKGE